MASEANGGRGAERGNEAFPPRGYGWHTDTEQPGGSSGARGRAFAGEAARALGVMACFVALTLLWAGLEERAARAHPPYPDFAVAQRASNRATTRGLEERGSRPTTWLVDGFNVLNVAMLSATEREAWWQEPVRARLVRLAEGFEDPEAELWIVFDGPHPAASGDPGTAGGARVRVLFEPSADEWLLGQVKAASDPTRLAVVTADRKLAARARHRGAHVVPPRVFLDRCPSRAAAGHQARSQGEAQPRLTGSGLSPPITRKAGGAAERS